MHFFFFFFLNTQIHDILLYTHFFVVSSEVLHTVPAAFSCGLPDPSPSHRDSPEPNHLCRCGPKLQPATNKTELNRSKRLLSWLHATCSRAATAVTTTKKKKIPKKHKHKDPETGSCLYTQDLSRIGSLASVNCKNLRYILAVCHSARLHGVIVTSQGVMQCCAALSMPFCMIYY